MARGAKTSWHTSEPALQAYLLGMVDFEAALSLQRRLHYDVAGDRTQSALILCEHPPLVTVGRHGSRAHLRFEPGNPWQVRWINRGGGCLLHVPGQIAIYPILPLDRLGLSIPEYLGKLGEVIRKLLLDFSLRKNEITATDAAVWVGGRPIAALGLAVRNWVTYFGAYLNVYPYLESFRMLACTAGGPEPMTSLERERHGPVRPSLVRQRLLEHFAETFGFTRTAMFSEHPALQALHDRRREPSQVAR